MDISFINIVILLKEMNALLPTHSCVLEEFILKLQLSISMLRSASNGQIRSSPSDSPVGILSQKASLKGLPPFSRRFLSGFSAKDEQRLFPVNSPSFPCCCFGADSFHL